MIQTLTQGVVKQGRRQHGKQVGKPAADPRALPPLPRKSAEFFLQQREMALQDHGRVLQPFMPVCCPPLHKLLYAGSGGMFSASGRAPKLQPRQFRVN